MLYGATLFGVGSNTKIVVCSLISHGLIFACVFKRRFSRMPFLPLPFQRRIPALARSPALSSTWGRGAASPAGGIPFGRSCTFQATESCDKYILAKKHDHSRISKRMEKALKKQQFPRLWTSYVIIKEIERWGGLA